MRASGAGSLADERMFAHLLRAARRLSATPRGNPSNDYASVVLGRAGA